MRDADGDRESGCSNLVKLLGAIAALITAVTGLLALFWHDSSPKMELPSPVPRTVTLDTPESFQSRERFQPAKPAELVNLTGTWFEPGGNAVIITQTGTFITISMPQLEAYFGAPGATTMIGSVDVLDDGYHMARLQAANAGMSLSLLVNKGGMSMEGTAINGLTSNAVVLTRGR